MLDYLQRTRRVTPALESRAREYLSLGYQRLLSFECAGGGFEWWGKGKGIVFLTAYGLQEFADMRRVFDVDDRVLERSRRFLLATQGSDGAWRNQVSTHGSPLDRLSAAEQKLGLTAYVLWSLLAAGSPADDPAIARGLEWLRLHRDTSDPYLRAVSALSLLSADPADRVALAVLDELVRVAVRGDGQAHWTGGTSVVSYAGGVSRDIETTATVVLALQKAGRHLDLASDALAWLVAQKDPSGAWHSTQATILTLKALLGAAVGSSDSVRGAAVVRLNGHELGRAEVVPEDADLVRQIETRERVRAGDNEVEVAWEGSPGLMAQVVARWYVPWDAAPPADAPFALQVAYDHTRAARGERIRCSVAVENRRPLASRMVMVCVGTPPGFTVETGELEGLVAAGKIAKFELNAHELVLYLDELVAGGRCELSWPLTARWAVEARSAPSRVYEYYAPEVEAVAPPQAFVVE